MKEDVIEIIYSCLRELNALGINAPELQDPTPDTRLFGAKSPLDSMALVNLIADLEEKIAGRFGQDLVLADERAMSRMHSPFRRVDSLADYIVERLAEGRSGGANK